VDPTRRTSVKPGERCEHGILYPHECKDCIEELDPKRKRAPEYELDNEVDGPAEDDKGDWSCVFTVKEQKSSVQFKFRIVDGILQVDTYYNLDVEHVNNKTDARTLLREVLEDPLMLMDPGFQRKARVATHIREGRG
jgi:hypothetical protein